MPGPDFSLDEPLAARSDDPLILRADLKSIVISSDRPSSSSTHRSLRSGVLRRFGSSAAGGRVVQQGALRYSFERPLLLPRFINAQSRRAPHEYATGPGSWLPRSWRGWRIASCRTEPDEVRVRLQEVHRVGRARARSSPRWCAAPARAPTHRAQSAGPRFSGTRSWRGRSTSTRSTPDDSRRHPAGPAGRKATTPCAPLWRRLGIDDDRIPSGSRTAAPGMREDVGHARLEVPDLRPALHPELRLGLSEEFRIAPTAGPMSRQNIPFPQTNVRTCSTTTSPTGRWRPVHLRHRPPLPIFSVMIGLRVLEDDLARFPAYRACCFYRPSS